MKNVHTFVLALLSFFVAAPLFSQISFSDGTDIIGGLGLTSGLAVGVADMDGDGLDDIVRLGNGYDLNIEYQTPDGQPFTHFHHGNVPDGAWALSLGDVNNDGLCDLMVGGFYDGVKILTAIDTGAVGFQLATAPGATIFSQGSNFADINNDGFLDVFSCHDDGESRIWGNDGTGHFLEADDWIDMRTNPASDNSGNYGTVWTDFDNDNDVDLYIAKCRQGVDDPEDPRRINALFVNDGHSNYTEQAGEHGLKIKHQSWTADFQDIDNDGDMDCFVTNHGHNLQLLENDGSGHFTDISIAAGLGAYSDYYLQGILRDFDNDGFMDLLAGAPSVLFHNNGDNTFSPMSSPFGNGYRLSSFAVGDLNHDGFVDVYGVFQCGINSPCDKPDRLFLNDGNDNHFLSVALKGNQSNRMGVGARIEAHGSWGIQIREMRSGESYGISNSLTKIFGLGAATKVDYVVVRWPSGVVDVLGNVDADQFLQIEEGSTCTLPEFELTLDGDPVLCGNESVQITAPEGYVYLWNDGSAGASVNVGSPGNYSVVIVDENGCAAASQVVKVTAAPDETPTVEVTGDTRFCEGGSVELSSSEAESYLWSNGATGQSITVTEPGEYFVAIEGSCSEFVSAIIEVEVLEKADVPVAEDVTVFEPDVSVTLEATGNSPRWYETPDASDFIAEGNTFETPILAQTTTYYVSDVNKYGGGDFETGMLAHEGSLYNAAGFNGQILFDAYQAVLLKQVTVATDSAGARTIELLDADGQVLQSLEIDLPTGQSVVDLGFWIEPGSGYKLATNTGKNQEVLGTVSPRLIRSDEGVQYPYEVPGVLSITGSQFGPGFYYYFYDWQVELPADECESERAAVSVIFEVDAAKEAMPFGKLQVQPNPSDGAFLLKMQALATGRADLSVFDITGKEIFHENFLASQNTESEKEVDIRFAPAGIYFLKIKSGDRVGRLKLLVAE
ncbi:MAG TPA: T9SS type A sorting domain-containing protein [Bacteroidetes bacterium]|nr:T9SS type A sorting domain-containing protein [Bacteroidota bacterium]